MTGVEDERVLLAFEKRAFNYDSAWVMLTNLALLTIQWSEAKPTCTSDKLYTALSTTSGIRDRV